jgi:hypothetical protein
MKSIARLLALTAPFKQIVVRDSSNATLYSFGMSAQVVR